MKAAMDDDTHDECDSEQDPADLISTSIDQPFQRINDDCESVMTSSQTLCHSPRVRPNRSILKKNKEVVSCDVKARSCRSKSVTFCVPDDTPRKRKERNPILKVLEAFDRKFSQECEISPSRQKLNVFERKRDDSNGSPNNSEGSVPYWIAYLHMNQKRRCNPMERMRRADIKREFGHFLTCRSSSLNSARNMGSPLKRDDQPFWSSTNGDELDCRCIYRQCTQCSPSAQKRTAINNYTTRFVTHNNNNNILTANKATPCDTLLDRKHLYWRESRNNRTTHTC